MTDAAAIDRLIWREGDITFIKKARAQEPVRIVLRGDVSGHDFHGNQWTGPIGGGGELAPVSGQGVKASVSQALTMKGLPAKIGEAVKLRMTQDMGIGPRAASNNLVNMFERAKEQGTVDEYKNWYHEAHDFNQTEAERSHLDPSVVTAITAALSPGQSWDTNMRATSAVIDTFAKADQVVPPDLVQAVNDKIDELAATRESKGFEPLPTERITDGQTFRDVMAMDDRTGAIMIGRDNGIQLRTYDNLTKAVDLGLANDPATIDGTLNGPKVRSFFNNMENPDSPTGNVTIDSHMMQAMANGLGSQDGYDRMRQMDERQSKITSTPSYNNASIGVYPIAADVMRTTTDRINASHEGEPGFPLLANQVQASIWGQQIKDYPLVRMRNILSGKEQFSG